MSSQILQLILMNANQVEEEAKFKQSLTQQLITAGLIKSADESFEYKPFPLYQLVCRRGGYQAVTNRNEWETISNQITGNGAKSVKIFYLKFIFVYEKKHYFGVDNDDQLPNLILGEPRKMVKTDGMQIKPKNEEYINVQNEISKTLQEQQMSSKLFYLKKSKLNTSKAQTKKIIMGLQPFMCRKQIIYSLNMLILYSVNNHHPFLFQNHQKIFTALSSFTQNIYPPKNIQETEDLRTITLIFRNLTMNPLNLKFMLGTPIFQLFVNMFNTGFDSECSKNIVDIMNGLVKVGWDCSQILKDIHNAILDDRYQDVEGAVELLRGLIDERDETLAPAVTQNIKVFLRVLMCNQVAIEVKEQIFEILAFVTDISSSSREELLRNDTLLSIIIGILQHMKSQQKLIQFVALTLSNMSSSPTAKHYLKCYESQLMVIGFSDDSLAGIISNLLTELSH